MSEQFRWGRRKYVSFILLDLVCLILSNLIAALIYHAVGDQSYTLSDYMMAMLVMAIIDVVVTLVFNTLNNVLRRRKKTEIFESAKHVILSFVVLALVFFSLKRGAAYSRLTIYLAYIIDFFAIIIARIIWKQIVKQIKARQSKKPTALIVTTSAYTSEGINMLKNSVEIKGLFVTDKTNEGKIDNIPIIVDSKDASAFICWMLVEKVFICGPDNIDVPETVLNACKQMGVSVHTAPTQKRFEYEVVKIRTALQKDDPTSGLSFFESEHDIPFKIRRLCSIYEKEQDRQTGYHPSKQSWHLLFCPYGSIDVYLDTGKEQKHILLDNPSVGLILHPSIWREMMWKERGSVLCVASSGHYGMETLRTDYEEYLQFIKKKDWSAVVESSDIMGEMMV